MAASISLNASVIPNGSQITIAVAGGPGNPGDWIGLYRAVGAITYGTYRDWVYVYTGRQETSPLGITNKVITTSLYVNTPGTYVIRLRDGVGDIVRAEFFFTVVDTGLIVTPPLVHWTSINTSCPITIREHGLVVFQNRMWIVGGFTSSSGFTNGISQKVFVSSLNGCQWKEVGLNSLPRALKAIRAVVFQNRIWIFGGTDGVGARNEVYSSYDGLTWTLESYLPANLTDNYMAVVFLGKIFLFYYDVMYSSSDGITWTTAPMPFLSATSHAIQGDAVVHNGRLYLFQGYGSDNILSTADGVTWSIAGVVPCPGFARWGYSVLSYNGKLWYIGGLDTVHRASAYSSADGASWDYHVMGDTSLDLYETITLQRSVVFLDRMWNMGGYVPFGNGTSAILSFSTDTIGLGMIKHRHQTTVPDNPLLDISSNEWNDSLVVSGETGSQDGMPIVRDASKTDGWGFSKNIWAILQVMQWTGRQTPNTNTLNDICWSPELSLFVAVAASGVGNRVSTSPDGIVWTARTTPADNTWRGVAWSPGLSLFAAVAGSGAGNRVMTSPNGTTWTIRTTPADNGWESIAWSPSLGMFVAVSNTDPGVVGRVMTSTDGITWTIRAVTGAHGWRRIVWAAGISLFVAVGDSGTSRVMTSPDGVTWTTRATPADGAFWYGLAWSPELNLFVTTGGAGGTGVLGKLVMTSPDGITWTLRSSGHPYDMYQVAWSPELGLFTGVGTQLATSPDGINWTTRQSAPVSGGSHSSIAWSPSLKMFAVTISAASFLNIMTSTPVVM